MKILFLPWSFPGDEMFSDSFKIKLVDDVIYEVYGKQITRTQGDVQIEGFNPSAEEADEGTDSACETGIDVVLNHRLSESYAFPDKKSYTLYLKDYMKKWVDLCFGRWTMTFISLSARNTMYLQWILRKLEQRSIEWDFEWKHRQDWFDRNFLTSDPLQISESSPTWKRSNQRK